MCPVVQIPEGKKIRCALAHDHVLLRQGLRRLLEDAPDIVVVAEAGTAAEALRRVGEERPDIVIAEPQLFEIPADQIATLVLRESPGTRLLLLADRDIEDVGHSGGIRCMIRHATFEELVEMVRRTAAPEKVANGEGTLSPMDDILPRNRMLTAREMEVLKLLAEGRTVRSVAGMLGLSVKTVDAHKFNLMRKLGIHNKAELVMWAVQQKVVKVPVNF